jgi:hypothetical protein
LETHKNNRLFLLPYQGQLGLNAYLVTFFIITHCPVGNPQPDPFIFATMRFVAGAAGIELSWTSGASRVMYDKTKG